MLVVAYHNLIVQELNPAMLEWLYHTQHAHTCTGVFVTAANSFC